MKIINFFLFTIIYIAASIVLLGNPYHPLAAGLIYLRYIFILFGFFILASIYLNKNGLRVFRFTSTFALYLYFVWILFSLSVVLSEIINQSFPFQGMFFLFVVPFIYFTVMPFSTRNDQLVVNQALFAANFFYIILSYLTTPVAFEPYSGITANPNGFGQISAIAFITGFFIFINLPKKRRLIKLLLIAAIFLSFVSVLISSSRTSLLVIVCGIFIISIYYYFIRRNIKPFIIITLVGLIGWFSPIRQMFLNGIVEKFSTTYKEGNLFSGRTGIWETVLNDSTLFGNGENYFGKFFEGAHNSIIYILGVYGILPAMLLTVFLLLLVLHALRNAFKKKGEQSAIFSLVIIATFVLFSTTEAMLGQIGNGITIAFYQVVGLLFFNEEIQKRAKRVG
jgi:O-antigen ligase